jgi:hypothetical protein
MIKSTMLIVAKATILIIIAPTTYFLGKLA